MGFWHNTLGVLSGGANNETPSVDPQTGASTTTSTPKTTGEMFRGMLAGMLTGLSGGVQANREGMHGGLGALAGGFEATQAQQQKVQQVKRQQAQSQFENQQKSEKQKAEMAMMAQQQAQSIAEVAHVNSETKRLDQSISNENWEQVQRENDVARAAADRAVNLANAPLAKGTGAFTKIEDAEAVAHKLLAEERAKPGGGDFYKYQLAHNDEGKFFIKEVPNDDAKVVSINMPDGSSTKQILTPAEANVMQGKMNEEKRENRKLDLQSRLTESEIAKNVATAKEAGQRFQQQIDIIKEKKTFSAGQLATVKYKVRDNIDTLAKQAAAMKQNGQDKDEKGQPSEAYQDVIDALQNAKDQINELNQVVAPGTVRVDGSLAPKGILVPVGASSNVAAGVNIINEAMGKGIGTDEIEKNIDSYKVFSTAEKKQLKALLRHP